MSKVKLNVIVALNAPKKAAVESFMTKYYQLMEKPAPFFGQERNYDPLNDDGERFPSESQKIQLKVDEVLKDLQDAWINMYDVVLTNDIGNSAAKSDIVVDGVTLLKDVPVSNLIWLQKQLDNWRSVIRSLPRLTLVDNWTFDPASGFYHSDPVKTHRTAKSQEPIVLYDATDKHPAQTQLITKDVTVGHWTTKKLSSAYPNSKIDELLRKLEKLREATLQARESANVTEIDQCNGGKVLLDYIFS